MLLSLNLTIVETVLPSLSGVKESSCLERRIFGSTVVKISSHMKNRISVGNDMIGGRVRLAEHEL